jgi:alkanesulfonate monooxygenase SsuD/methylene tetrahydromethanopterin reductase-like flavin-dependent oxidoreductase (luciferase family)
MPSVQLFSWHFMAYPYLPDDFDDHHETSWAVVPNALWDRDATEGLYQEYIDQLIYADELGFDGMTLNEHHQTAYGLMPSPNIIAAALTQRTRQAKICVLGNLIPLRGNPLRIAEEYAMIDNMSGGRLIAGFAIGSGPEAFTYNVPQPQGRRRFWEGLDLIVRAWTEDGPFEHEGEHFPLRYVNPWPKPRQRPHPPIWVPGGLSVETMHELAKRGYDYFLSLRTHGRVTQQAVGRFADILESHGDKFHPFRMGLLMSVYVAETDEQAREEAEEGVWYFLRYMLKGHLRRAGRQLTFGAGVPSQSVDSWRRYLENADPMAPLLGDCQNWDEVDAAGAIVVGSPETVRKRLWDLIEMTDVGNLLIQFHLGNMPDDLVRKSMRLFATEVAPALRRDSSELFARKFPALEAETAS